MKKTLIIISLGILVVLGYLFFNKDQGHGASSLPSDSPYTIGQESSDQEKGVKAEGEESNQNHVDYSEIPLYYKAKKAHIEDLSEFEQIAVRFMTDFINTDKTETKEQYLDRLAPFVIRGNMESLSFNDIMGHEYLPAFESNRKLDEIYVAGTYERNVSNVVFVRVVFQDEELDVPLMISKEGKRVFGYSDTDRVNIHKID